MTETDKDNNQARNEARQAVSLLADYMRLEAVDVMTVGITVGVAFVVLCVFFGAGILCLAWALSSLLSSLVGSATGGYALTGVLLLLLGVGFWMARKALLENVIMRAVAKVVMKIGAKVPKDVSDADNTTIAKK